MIYPTWKLKDHCLQFSHTVDQLTEAAYSFLRRSTAVERFSLARLILDCWDFPRMPCLILSTNRSCNASSRLYAPMVDHTAYNRIFSLSRNAKIKVQIPRLGFSPKSRPSNESQCFSKTTQRYYTCYAQITGVSSPILWAVKSVLKTKELT